jgi:hypothetical protein
MVEARSRRMPITPPDVAVPPCSAVGQGKPHALSRWPLIASELNSAATTCTPSATHAASTYKAGRGVRLRQMALDSM